ncbi:MAG: ferrochelatase [Rhodanobacter sp.]|nr:MAG: ferrochelatase [Rhodanobacter sp.]TAM14130.1 MAG: ferrochelatase [Rhodanobacter sp.]TAM34943.1 MAG: ferrochelatase [Rhodanobacter sp.]
MPQQTIGLLVMAYGTPHSPDAIESFYTHIRHGQKPTDALLQDLKDRYRAIGGISPLGRITKGQADALAAALNARGCGYAFKSYIGLKHAEPFIEDAVAAMHRDGITQAVALVLAPYDGNASVQGYAARAQAAAVRLGGLTITTVSGWYRQEKFIRHWAGQIETALAAIPEDEVSTTAVVFSSHSLPKTMPGVSEHYQRQLEESARAIARAARLGRYATAWQSAGRTADVWLGPDIRELTRGLYRHGGYRTFIYCPTGFVAEHLEVLYDMDIECRAVVNELGGRYIRPAMPNAAPLFIDGLADAALDALAHAMAVPA